MVAVSTRHHLEQPTVGAAEDAESTVFGDPRHVGEHQTVVQLTTAVRSENSTGVIGVTVRGTECSSAIDPFRSLFGPIAINGGSSSTNLTARASQTRAEGQPLGPALVGQ